MTDERPYWVCGRKSWWLVRVGAVNPPDRLSRSPLGWIAEQYQRRHQAWYASVERREADRCRRAAATDRRGAQLQANLDDHGGLTLDEWDEYRSIVGSAYGHRSWVEAVVGRSLSPLLDLTERYVARHQQILEFAQRAARGWADTDTPLLDRYLAGVMAGSLRHFADHRYMYPGPDSPWPTPEAWRAALHAEAARFDRLRHPEDLAPQERERLVAETFDVLGRLWPWLWD